MAKARPRIGKIRQKSLSFSRVFPRRRAVSRFAPARLQGARGAHRSPLPRPWRESRDWPAWPPAFRLGRRASRSPVSSRLASAARSITPSSGSATSTAAHEKLRAAVLARRRRRPTPVRRASRSACPPNARARACAGLIRANHDQRAISRPAGRFISAARRAHFRDQFDDPAGLRLRLGVLQLGEPRPARPGASMPSRASPSRPLIAHSSSVMKGMKGCSRA